MKARSTATICNAGGDGAASRLLVVDRADLQLRFSDLVMFQSKLEAPMSIRWHKDLGVNPRLTVCQACGKVLSTILLCGNQNFLWHCNDCDVTFIGKERARKCVQCKETNIKRIRELSEFEKIPLGFCEQCQQLKDTAAKAVAEGGVFWRCKTCGSSGALTKDNPLAPLVREKLQIPPPKPCGVEVNNCPVCTQEKQN